MTVELTNPEGLATPPNVFYHHVAVGTGSRQVHVAGQIATGADGTLVSEDLAGQVAQAYRNVATALASVGAAMGDVVRLTYYVTEWTPDQFPALEEGVQRVAEEVGRSTAPASLIGVQMLFQPGVRVEIEAIAVVD